MKKRLWPVFKLLLALAILVAVGRRFYYDLQLLDFDQLSVNAGWLILSAVLYIVALGISAGFWYMLLHVFGETPRPWKTLRAYYLGHLGKYVPGKAWALILRSGLACGPGVRVGVAAITSFYEVLTTMAAGALLAACIFVVQPPTVSEWRWNPLATGVVLLGLLGVPLLPGVFNLIVRQMARRFQSVEALALPSIKFRTLVIGLILTSFGWLLMGLSVWMTLKAVAGEDLDFTLPLLAQCTAALGFAYVAGFLAIVVPGGVGVREFFLLQLLRPLVTSEAYLAWAIILLRLVWTTAELIIAAILYFTPSREPLAA